MTAVFLFGRLPLVIRLSGTDEIPHFLSNPTELAMLKTEEYRKKVAACIFTGAANYMSETITEEVN